MKKINFWQKLWKSLRLYKIDILCFYQGFYLEHYQTLFSKLSYIRKIHFLYKVAILTDEE